MMVCARRPLGFITPYDEQKQRTRYARLPNKPRRRKPATQAEPPAKVFRLRGSRTTGFLRGRIKGLPLDQPEVYLRPGHSTAGGGVRTKRDPMHDPTTPRGHTGGWSP